jgi:hypothetical protein
MLLKKVMGCGTGEVLRQLRTGMRVKGCCCTLVLMQGGTELGPC